MVGNTGRATDTRRIRRLKSRYDIEVEADAAGAPLRLRLGSVWQDVELTRRPWRIDQHWWRGEPVSRVYYRVAPAEGTALTIYNDLVSGAWFRQEYR
jgi:hypothetical protein